tara:strand:- start:1523 stop:1801 length:279 start_codon:yes stop_codon:yes gene_type:complete
MTHPGTYTLLTRYEILYDVLTEANQQQVLRKTEWTVRMVKSSGDIPPRTCFCFLNNKGKKRKDSLYDRHSHEGATVLLCCGRRRGAARKEVA